MTVKPSAETSANGILYGEVAPPAYSVGDEEDFCVLPHHEGMQHTPGRAFILTSAIAGRLFTFALRESRPEQ